MTLYDGVLFVATFLNGLLAGVFFTWTNAITTGIGRLSDLAYLEAFQSMNKTILNPLFFIVFFGSIVFCPIAILIRYDGGMDVQFWVLLAVCLLYGIGVVAITFLGNIPLNNRLDNLDLKRTSLSEAAVFRDAFETKWNGLHLIRTLSSGASLALLIILLLLSNKF